MAEVLLRHGADTNAKDLGRMPLHYAALINAHAMAEVLLKHGADINVKDDDWRPLHYAAAKNAHATAKVLLKHGADINAKDTRGRTPIDRAAHETAVLLRRYMLSHSGSQE